MSISFQFLVFFLKVITNLEYTIIDADLKKEIIDYLSEIVMRASEFKDIFITFAFNELPIHFRKKRN